MSSATVLTFPSTRHYPPDWHDQAWWYAESFRVGSDWVSLGEAAAEAMRFVAATMGASS